jgi:hypothetical protein
VRIWLVNSDIVVIIVVVVVVVVVVFRSCRDRI